MVDSNALLGAVFSAMKLFTRSPGLSRVRENCQDDRETLSAMGEGTAETAYS